jgi:hypothetical protein
MILATSTLNEMRRTEASGGRKRNEWIKVVVLPDPAFELTTMALGVERKEGDREEAGVDDEEEGVRCVGECEGEEDSEHVEVGWDGWWRWKSCCFVERIRCVDSINSKTAVCSGVA